MTKQYRYKCHYFLKSGEHQVLHTIATGPGEAEALVRGFIGNDRIARMTGTVRDEDMWVD